METKSREELLEKLGWVIICNSPLEIEYGDGSFASGMAADIVIEELMKNYEDYLDEED